MRKQLQVAVNDKSRRIGEANQAARLTDHEVGLIRELLEDGLSTGEIVKKFDRMVTRQQVWRIGRYQSRADHPADLRELYQRECTHCGVMFGSTNPRYRRCTDCRRNVRVKGDRMAGRQQARQ